MEDNSQVVNTVQDYLECLHHRKEIARMNTVLLEAKRQEDAAAGVRQLCIKYGHPVWLNVSTAVTIS